MPNFEVLLGPLGLTAVLAYIAKLLWEAHKAADADVVRQRDEALALADRASAGWKVQTDANAKMAETHARRRASDRAKVDGT